MVHTIRFLLFNNVVLFHLSLSCNECRCFEKLNVDDGWRHAYHLTAINPVRLSPYRISSDEPGGSSFPQLPSQRKDYFKGELLLEEIR